MNARTPLGKGNGRHMPEWSSHAGWMARLAKEPLVQFALAGALIFGLQQLITSRGEEHDRRIVIDAGLTAHMRQLHEVQFGMPPDAAELDTLISRHVRDEALYREGLRLGLDRGDEVIRQRVVQKMETLLTDAELLPEPTDADLQAQLAAHPGRYGKNGRSTFRQRYFAILDGDSATAQARARDALQRLARDPDARVPADSLALGEHFDDLDAADIVRRFGATDFAAAMWQAPIGQWAGPFQSGFGWHLLRVEAREPPRVPPLEEVRAAVREDWLAATRERQLRQRVDALAAGYTVVRATDR